MNVEMGQEYTTRDGRAVRIDHDDGAEPFQLIGSIKNPSGWVGAAWKRSGAACLYDIPWGSDLIEAPRKFRLERWVNVYSDESVRDGGKIHDSREKSDAVAKFTENFAPTRRIACIRVVIEGAEGDGLTHTTTQENAQ